MSDFNQCEAHEAISTPHCPTCLLDERDHLQSELTAAREENERVRLANLDVMNHYEDARDEAERFRARVEDAFCEGYKAAPTGLTKTNRVGMHVRVAAKDYAIRLRQQAQSIENGD